LFVDGFNIIILRLKFYNKKITGILTILPKNEIYFEDEMVNYNFTCAQSMKLKSIMGYNKHRITDDNTCVSDLAVAGMNYLFNKKLLKKTEVDALVLVTQSPDYFVPPTSLVIHGKLGLNKDIFCIDINQGCAGYIIGLYQSFMLLEQSNIKKVVLINADIASRKVNKKDRNSYPLVGDAASITIVENDESQSEIFANIKFDGTRYDTLIIPAGGFRLPSSPETGREEDDGNGNIRSKDNIIMKGDAVFNFVQTSVPPMIEELLDYAIIDINSIDYFMFHQPNKFMLQKLADKMKIPYEKIPSNVVENFGNNNGVTIPTAITFNLGEKLTKNKYNLCLAGFGVGLTWGAMLINTGNLKFCEMIDY
jgi:3-oxoacyl-[acyl-carrier-protein] synthase III